MPKTVSVLVPGVLDCTHVLEVDNRFYPIQVKKSRLSEVKLFASHKSLHMHAQFSPKRPRLFKDSTFCLKFCVLFQVDMPVKTTLDLSMFPNPGSVMKLLKQYDFKVTKLDAGHLQLTGSFLKLKLVRSELMRLSALTRPSHRSAPSVLHNGSTMGYDMEHGSLKSVSRNVDQMAAVKCYQLPDISPPSSSSYRDTASGGFPGSHQSSLSSYTAQNASSPVGAVRRQDRWSPLIDGASSLSANSPSSLHHTSPLYKDSASDQSQRSLHNSYYSSSGGTSPSTDSMHHHTSYRDSASVESPRSLHSSYYSSSGGTSPTMDTIHHHTSSRDSASGGSYRGHPSFHGDNSKSSASLRSPSSSAEKARLPVDTDTIDFIYTQRQDVVKEIEKLYGTQMGLTDNAFQCSMLSLVTFSGKNCEKAKEHLLAITEELRSSLRTQEINLKEYTPAEQKQIHHRISRHNDSGVMIKSTDNVIKLVGASIESFEMKQKILGHNDDPHRGRTLERNSKSRRSSSLPKQRKVANHTRVTDQENQTSAGRKYTPSHHQEESDEGNAPQIVQGPEQTSDKNSIRTRCKSESREKNRAAKEHQAMELPSSSQEKKPQIQRGIDRIKLNALQKLDRSRFKRK